MKSALFFLPLWLFSLSSLAQIAQVEHQQSIINNTFIPLMIDISEEDNPMFIGKAFNKKTNYHSREEGIPVVGAIESGLDIESVNLVEFPNGEGSYYTSFARQGDHCFFPINVLAPGAEADSSTFEIFEINAEGEAEERYLLFKREINRNDNPMLDRYEVFHLSYRSKDHRYLGILEFEKKLKKPARINATVFDTQKKSFWTKEIKMEDIRMEYSKLLTAYLSTQGKFHIALSIREKEFGTPSHILLNVSENAQGKTDLAGPDTFIRQFFCEYAASENDEELSIAFVPVETDGCPGLYFSRMEQATGKLLAAQKIDLSKEDFSNLERFKMKIEGFSGMGRNFELFVHPSGDLSAVLHVGSKLYYEDPGEHYFSCFEVLRFTAEGKKLWTKVYPHSLRVSSFKLQTTFPLYTINGEELYIFHNVSDHAYAWRENKVPPRKIGAVSKKNIMHPAVWKIETNGEATRSRIVGSPRIPIQFEHAVLVNETSFFFYANNCFEPSDPAIIGLISVE